MKLCFVLLLALVAMATADSEYYQYNTQPQATPQNQYYGQRRRESGIAGFVKGLFGAGDNRRQFTGIGTGTGGGIIGGGGGLIGGGANPFGFLGPLLTIGILLLLGIGLLAVALASLDLNSSGRGLDTDEWEVDHSVWMNQLQKDFEDSWSTE